MALPSAGVRVAIAPEGLRGADDADPPLVLLSIAIRSAMLDPDVAERDIDSGKR